MAWDARTAQVSQPGVAVVLVRRRHYFFCALRAHMGEFWHGIISWHYIMMFRPSSISYHMIFDMTMI